jgi:hypothetical protein
MVWEGRVAVGFAALVYVGPLWLGQAASTLFAALADGGIWPGWLWGWLVVAPLLGASPPAAAMARRSSRIFRGGAPDPDLHPSGAAVQQASNFAWADTTAEPGWELRRTPPLPLEWPPTRGGPAVWFCYAERPATPETVEVAARGRGSSSPVGERCRSSNGCPTAWNRWGHTAFSRLRQASSGRSWSRSYGVVIRTAYWPGR